MMVKKAKSIDEFDMKKFIDSMRLSFFSDETEDLLMALKTVGAIGIVTSMRLGHYFFTNNTRKAKALFWNDFVKKLKENLLENNSLLLSLCYAANENSEIGENEYLAIKRFLLDNGFIRSEINQGCLKTLNYLEQECGFTNLVSKTLYNDDLYTVTTICPVAESLVEELIREKLPALQLMAFEQFIKLYYNTSDTGILFTNYEYDLLDMVVQNLQRSMSEIYDTVNFEHE